MIHELYEYEKFLQTKFDNLDEGRGVYDLTYQIINTCYEYIRDNTNLLKFVSSESINDKEYNLYTCNFTIPLSDNSFMVNPIIRLRIHVGEPLLEVEGGFAPPNIDMLKDGKLVNPIFRVELFEKNKGKVSYGPFKQLMLHEVHHAYRWYNINMKSFRNDNEDKRIDTYQYFNQHKNDDDVSNLLSNIFYLIDDDEINAFSTEVYAIIEDNPDIDAGSYRWYLNEFPTYRHIKSLEKALHFFEHMGMNTDYEKNYYNNVSDIMNSAFKTSLTPRENRIKLINQLSNKILKKYKQFYKVLNKALVDFNRPCNMTESNRNIGKFLIEDLENSYKYFD